MGGGRGDRRAARALGGLLARGLLKPCPAAARATRMCKCDCGRGGGPGATRPGPPRGGPPSALTAPAAVLHPVVRLVPARAEAADADRRRGVGLAGAAAVCYGARRPHVAALRAALPRLQGREERGVRRMPAHAAEQRLAVLGMRGLWPRWAARGGGEACMRGANGEGAAGRGAPLPCPRLPGPHLEARLQVGHPPRVRCGLHLDGGSACGGAAFEKVRGPGPGGVRPQRNGVRRAPRGLAVQGRAAPAAPHPIRGAAWRLPGCYRARETGGPPRGRN